MIWRVWWQPARRASHLHGEQLPGVPEAQLTPVGVDAFHPPALRQQLGADTAAIPAAQAAAQIAELHHSLAAATAADHPAEAEILRQAGQRWQSGDTGSGGRPSGGSGASSGGSAGARGARGACSGASHGGSSRGRQGREGIATAKRHGIHHLPGRGQGGQARRGGPARRQPQAIGGGWRRHRSADQGCAVAGAAAHEDTKPKGETQGQGPNASRRDRGIGQGWPATHG